MDHYFFPLYNPPRPKPPRSQWQAFRLLPDRCPQSILDLISLSFISVFSNTWKPSVSDHCRRRFKLAWKACYFRGEFIPNSLLMNTEISVRGFNSFLDIHKITTFGYITILHQIYLCDRAHTYIHIYLNKYIEKFDSLCKQQFAPLYMSISISVNIYANIYGFLHKFAYNYACASAYVCIRNCIEIHEYSKYGCQ